MSDPVDQEIEAIRRVLSALQPLSEAVRASVLEYVTKRLSISMPTELPLSEGPPPHAPPPADTTRRTEVHIKDFKEEKKPRSANEMAALVAYYLENLIAPAKRKKTVNQQDLETYFKIARFPLPQSLRVTLPNAKNAGYFDSVGDGEYKLNAVGHNLVVHSMPRGSALARKKAKSAKKGKKKASTKKSAKKKSTRKKT